MLRKANIISYTLFGASAAMLVGVVYFALNIQVIKDWSLTLPPGDIHAGDTVVVASRYTKLKQVSGTSTRTLECESSKDIYISYPLNNAKANRAPGTTGTGLVVLMPTELAGTDGLPDTCHVCVALSYPVLPLRKVPYFKCTRNFTLLPSAGSSAATSSATQTSPVLAVSSSQVPAGDSVESSSSTNNAPVHPPAQSNLSQMNLQPAGLLTELLNQIVVAPLTNVLK